MKIHVFMQRNVVRSDDVYCDTARDAVNAIFSMALDIRNKPDPSEYMIGFYAEKIEDNREIIKHLGLMQLELRIELLMKVLPVMDFRTMLSPQVPD